MSLIRNSLFLVRRLLDNSIVASRTVPFLLTRISYSTETTTPISEPPREAPTEEPTEEPSGAPIAPSTKSLVARLRSDYAMLLISQVPTSALKEDVIEIFRKNGVDVHGARPLFTREYKPQGNWVVRVRKEDCPKALGIQAKIGPFPTRITRLYVRTA